MNERRPAETQVAAQYYDDRLSAIEKRVEAAGISLRETAKWITGGVALASAGIITGASLSSLGSLGLGLRLLAAISSVTVGVLALGHLLNAALAVADDEPIKQHAPPASCCLTEGAEASV